jgi:uncharacterized membrane protein YraQ (UPF0718 family)
VVNDIQDFVITFTSIVWEAMPFIVLGAVIAGVLEELLPQQVIGRLVPRYALGAVAVGGLLGLVFPMCECGIVVVMRRLLRKGLPLSCCIAYMLAGPIVNVVVMLSTYVAFGGLKAELQQQAWTMVGLRAGLGFLVACVTGLVVHAMYKKHGNSLLTAVATPRAAADADENGGKKTVFQRLSNISETALHDFVDITVFLILGAALASVVKLYVGPEQVTAIGREQPAVAILAMMGLAVLMCLCSEADAFVAASFTELTTAPKLAFLVLGPMLDLKLLMMYTRVFRPRLIAVLVACTVSQTAAYTLALHYLAPDPLRPTSSSVASPIESPPTPAPAPTPAPTTAPTGK